MKQLTKLFLFIIGFAAVMAACSKKEADLPFYYKGSAVILSSSLNTLAPTVADTSKPVLILSWTDPKYATDSASIKYIIQVDNVGKNFGSPISKEVTGARTAFFTARELNTIALNYGLGLGVAAKFEARIISSYGNNDDQYVSNVLPITVTPFADPATLTSSATSVTGTLATASSPSLTFSWSSAFKGYTGDVNYVLQYDTSGKGFTGTIYEMAIGIGKLSQAMTQADMNNAAINSGVKAGTLGKVEFRIRSTTASGIVSYSNVINVSVQTYVQILRLYVPGSYQAAAGMGNNWDPPTAPEMIRDLRPAVLNKLYYAYMYFNANDEFKITQGRAWDVNYGATASSIPASGATGSFGGNNFKITTSGWYRVSIDISNNKYDIRPGRMGFVGGATGAGWNPPNVFPTYALGAPANNLFVGLTNLTTDGWKLIDNDQWDNGSRAVDETRSYGVASGSGATLEVNGANFNNPSPAGRYRVIWDGRNVDNVTYQMSPATEMRLVGDGINGVAAWTPGASPQMTYAGNGKWTITIGLIGGKDIKFLAGNDWGAFDYEDNSGGSNATGVARKIKWEGGDNFKTPAASGTYTITLDENNQTVTIN